MAQYVVRENKFPRYIVDKPVNMCITNTLGNNLIGRKRFGNSST